MATLTLTRGRRVIVRAAARVAAVVLATAASTAALVTLHQTATAEASTLGGPITRAEVIARAQYWVDNQPGSYDQGAYSPGPDGDFNYRRDCSGYVSMAWHLDVNAWTGSLANYSHPIARSDLRAGDIMLDAGTHTFLFDHWEDGSGHFSYYTFGSTPVRHVTGASIYASYLDGHPNGDYQAYRYNKIIDDGGAGPEARLMQGSTMSVYQISGGNLYGKGQTAPGSLFGDWQQLSSGGNLVGRPSVVQFTDGTISVYARGTDGNVWAAGNTAAGGPFGDWGVVATGVAGDPEVRLMQNNTLALYAVHPDGNVYGLGQPSLGASFGSWQQLSSGGNFTGRPSVVQFADGTISVYARGTDGNVWAAGNKAAGGLFGDWGVVATDVISDPEVKLMQNGTLSVYAVRSDNNVYGLGQDAPGALFGPWQQLSAGGNTSGRPSVIQFTDGTLDLFARDTNGTLWASGNTRTGAGSPFGPWEQV